MTDFLEAVSSDGRRVLEADLRDESPDVWIARARERGAELGTGRVDLDSWGDDPAVIAAYEKLGFAVVERVTGWQLRLD